MPKYIKIQNKYTSEYKLEDDYPAKLPLMEFAYGSLGMSRKQALIELGFPEDKIDELMEERLAEDLLQEPDIRRYMGKQVAKKYRKELGIEDGQED